MDPFSIHPETTVGPVYLTVSNLKRSEKFYREVLGFKLLSRQDDSLTDGAWARIKPDDPKTVEIAFKLSMLGSPASYALGSWAGTNIDPSSFDYNDHMTHIQAGSPNPGDGVYPIKALAEIDNTCRLAIGFVPTSNQPGFCSVPAPKAQGPGQPPACNPNFYGLAGVPPCPNP